MKTDLDKSSDESLVREILNNFRESFEHADIIRQAREEAFRREWSR